MNYIIEYSKYISWIFTAIALTGSFLNSQMKISGFFAWLISNTWFMIFNIVNKHYAEAALFFAQNLICIRGLYVWNKDKSKSKK